MTSLWAVLIWKTVYVELTYQQLLTDNHLVQLSVSLTTATLTIQVARLCHAHALPRKCECLSKKNELQEPNMLPF